MKLYLDDVRECPLVGYVVARTLDEARSLLLSEPCEAISLDHDLGICDDCLDAMEAAAVLHCGHVGTGLDLLRWMDEHDIWPARIDVHSANPVGAQRMRDYIAGRRTPARERGEE